MDEIILQLKNGRTTTVFTVRGSTEEEAKEMASAVAGMWQSASSGERETLRKMIESNRELDYLKLNEKKLREFLQNANGSDYLIRRDARNTYHVICEKPSETERQEADAISQLRKRKAEAVLRKKEKEAAPKQHSKKDIADTVHKEVQPYMENIYAEFREINEKLQRLDIQEDD